MLGRRGVGEVVEGDRWCKNRERDREKRACGDGRGRDEESVCGRFWKVRHEGCEN